MIDNKSIFYIISTTLFLIIAVFFYSITLHDAVVGFLSDDAVYLMMADYYSPWSNNDSGVLKFVNENSRFPPLYPLSLGLAGVDITKPALATYITVGFLLLSFVFFGLWVYLETQRQWLALSLSVLVAFLPGTLLLSQELWSEFLFMFLLYAVLCLHSVKRKEQGYWLLIALLIGLATMTRSIGLSLALIYSVLLLYKKPKKYMLYIIISLAPFCYWQLAHVGTSNSQSYFSDVVSHFKALSLNAIPEYMFNHIIDVWQAWYWNYSALNNPWSIKKLEVVLSLIMSFSLLMGFYFRIKQKKIDAFYLLVYLSILFVWPYSNLHYMSRFIYPVIPLLLFYMWYGLENAFVGSRYIKYYFGILLCITFIIAFPSTKQIINRAYASTDTKITPYIRSREWLLAPTYEEAYNMAVKSKRLIEVLKEIEEYIPDNECIYAFQTPMVMLYSQRVAGVFKRPEKSLQNFKNETQSCRFMVAMYLIDGSKTFPPFYPMHLIWDKGGYEFTPFYLNSSQKNEPILYLIQQIR